MKTYKHFVNEEVVKDFLNKAFRSALKVINKDDAGEAKNFINDLNRPNNITESLNIFRKYMETRSKTMKDSKNVADIKNNLKTDLVITDITLRDLSRKYDMESLMPNKLYAESNNKLLKDLFSSESAEDFAKNVDLKINALIVNLAKTSGLNEEQTSKLTQTEQKNESKLFEQEETIQNTPSETPQENTEQPQNVLDEESFTKFKQTSEEFITKGLFEPLYKKLEEVTKNMATGTDQNVDNIVDKMKGSNNKDSMKSIVNKVVNADKDTLMKMRDFVGLNKDNAPL